MRMDYASVLHALLVTKRKMEKENKRVLKVTNPRMLVLFGFPPWNVPKLQEGPRHQFRCCIGKKNVDFHARYDDDEFKHLFKLCCKLESKPILESIGATPEAIHQLVKDLEDMRRHFKDNFVLEDGRKTDLD